MSARWLIFFFCLLGWIVNTSAESSSQSWGILNFDLPIFKDTDQYRLYLETQPRYNFSEGRSEGVFLATAFGYRLNSNLALWTGYNWNTTTFRPTGEDRIDEHRLWQQLSYNQSLQQLRVGHRFRIEHSYLETISEPTQRLRYLIRLSQPIFTVNQQVYGITFFNEIMYRLNTISPNLHAGWDRNRTFLGPYLEYQQMRYELGYLFETIRIDEHPNRNNHVLRVVLSFVFN